MWKLFRCVYVSVICFVIWYVHGLIWLILKNSIWIILWMCLSFVYLFTVPDDVFAPNYVWKGSYNYKGRKQPMTLSITSFNTTTGRVNVTLTSSNMELLLSGRFIVKLHRFTELIEQIIIQACKHEDCLFLPSPNLI